MSLFNFQGAAGEQGRAFRDECLRALSYAGFEVADTEVHLEDVGITLDAITNNRRGLAMAWEFKGSLQGSRPGLLRTDTMKKAIANGWLFSKSEISQLIVSRMLVMTSHIPTDNDSSLMLQVALEDGLLLDVIDSRDGKRLQRLATADEYQLRTWINNVTARMAAD